jgi:hypothetical protein
MFVDSCLTSTVLESDEELWAKIVGDGSKERERTEPWRSVTLLDGFRDDITVLRDALAQSDILPYSFGGM